jgi:hypothetical protein
LHLLTSRSYLPLTSFPQSQSGGPSVGQEPDLNPSAHLGLEKLLRDQRLRITTEKRQSSHVSDAPLESEDKAKVVDDPLESEDKAKVVDNHLESEDKAKVVDDPVCPGILLAGPGISLFAS